MAAVCFLSQKSYLIFPFFFSPGRKNHVRTRTLPQLFDRQPQVLLHFICRRCKYLAYSQTNLDSFDHVFSRVLSQTCQIGLNFASEEEAKRFRAAINDLLNRRQRKSGMCQVFESWLTFLLQTSP